MDGSSGRSRVISVRDDIYGKMRILKVPLID